MSLAASLVGLAGREAAKASEDESVRETRLRRHAEADLVRESAWAARASRR